MFVHHCTACDRRQLIFASMTSGVATTDHGIDVAFTCWCGAEQTAHTGLSGVPDEREVAAA